MNIKTISLISQITTLFSFSNLRFNHLLLVTIKEVLIMVEMMDMADIAEEVHVVDEAEEGEGTEKVEEEEISKLTANRNLKAKVGKLKHLLLSLLLPKRKILIHFLTLVRHNNLNILQTSQIILKFSKVSYVIIRNS